MNGHGAFARMKTNVQLLRNPGPGYEFFRNFFIIFARDPDVLDMRCFNAVDQEFQDGVVSLSELYTVFQWILKRLPEPDSRQKISVSPRSPHVPL